MFQYLTSRGLYVGDHPIPKGDEFSSFNSTGGDLVP